MQHYRCKCGKSTAFGSYPPSPCTSCEECGTTFAQHPDFYHEPIPHDVVVESHHGKVRARCRVCCKQLDLALAPKEELLRFSNQMYGNIGDVNEALVKLNSTS